MVIDARLGAVGCELWLRGPDQLGAAYDSENWLKEGRFDLAVVIAETAFEVTRRRFLATGKHRSILDCRLRAHGRWTRYQSLKHAARDAFLTRARGPARLTRANSLTLSLNSWSPWKRFSLGA